MYVGTGAFMSPQRERIALAFLSALLLLPVSMTNAAPDEPLCILAPSEMPSAWKRWGGRAEIHFGKALVRCRKS